MNKEAAEEENGGQGMVEVEKIKKITLPIVLAIVVLAVLMFQ